MHMHNSRVNLYKCVVVTAVLVIIIIIVVILSLVSLTFDLQTRPSKGPNMSSI